jgi:hypothetical protein
MASHIELTCEPDGRWVAEVSALPGLQLYGSSQDETLEAARKLNAMLCYKGTREAEGILAFYPGRIPDAALSRGSGSATEDLNQIVYINDQLVRH